MTVKSIGAYDVAPVDPPENFGGHLLFYVYNEGNTFFASLNTFRAPPETPWPVFRVEMLNPWLGTDPDLDQAALANWRVDDQPISPGEGDTLASLGIGWKSVVRVNC